MSGLPRPPNYPLILPQIPTIKGHKGSTIEGPLEGPGSDGCLEVIPLGFSC